MKFLIVGPGAMGCLFAARLKKAGHDVTLFDHIEKRADLINKQGIKVEGILGEYSVHVPTVTGKIADFPDVALRLITPREPGRRGCQLSIGLGGTDRRLFDELTRRGAITDFREPDVIRIAPVPLYNSFEDVFRLGEALRDALTQVR